MPKTADAEKAPAKSAAKPAAKAPGKVAAKESASDGGAPKAAAKPAGKDAAAKVKAPEKGKAPEKAPEKAAAKPAEKAPAKTTNKPAAKAPTTPPTKGASAKPAPKPEATKAAPSKPPSVKTTEPAKPAPSKTIVMKPTGKLLARPDSKSDKDKDKNEVRPLERVVERVVNGVRSLVWGPVDTKRFGRTLVVDMSAPQVAMTARRGLSIPRASLIVTTAAREIITLAREAVKIDTIAVVGSDTDPSGHPDLREITENLRALRDKHLQRAKLRVFTTTRDLTSYDLRSTLAMYDRVHLQLEWGTAKVFTAITGEKPAQLTTLLKHATGFDHLVVEASFFKGPEDHDNSSDAEVKLWIKKLQEVKPQEVHILPGAGSGTNVPKVKAVPKSRRDEIIEEVSDKTGLNVVVVHEDDVVFV